jgi:hypothetical protein
VFNKYNITLNIWLVTGIAFLLFLLLLFSHLCFGYDEYIWKTLYERHGFSGFFRHIYDSMSFRYSTHFYIYLTFNFSGPASYRIFVFISQLFTFSILLVSLYAVFKTIFRSWLSMAISGLHLLVSALITGAGLYYLTSQIVEIYTYTSSFYSYFMPVAFFCLALSVIISEKNGFRSWLMLFIASFSVGGSAENVSASFLACTGIFFLVAVLRSKFDLRILFADKRILKLFVFVLLTSLFTLIAYTAPGASNRAAQEATNLLLKSNALFAPHQLDIFLGKYFHISNLAGVLLLCWFIYLGTLIPGEKKGLVKKIFYWCCWSFAISVLIHLAITKLIFDSYGYLRIWYPVNFHMCLLLVAVLLYAGTRLRTSGAIAVSTGAAFVSLLFILTYSIRHYPKVRSFSEAYFERRSEIANACAITPENEIYISKKLPDPDILYYDKFVRFPKDSLTVYFCIFNEIPCKNVYVK